MKQKVTIYLPLNIANWLLLECDFHQAMLDEAISDLDCLDSAPSAKKPLMRDYCNYGVVHSILAKTLAKVLRK